MAAETLARMQANAAMNPLVSIVRKYAGDVIRYANEFGLTAAARSRMGACGYTAAGSGKFDGLLSDGGTVVPMKPRGDE